MIPVNLGDPDDAAPWLDAVRDAVADAVAAALDATRPYSQRVLARPEARRTIEASARTLDALLAAAGAPPATPHPRTGRLVLLRPAETPPADPDPAC